MLSVHITALTDEELDAVAAGGTVTITRNYSAAGTTSTIDSDITASSFTVGPLQSVTLTEKSTVVSTGPAATV